MTLPAARLLARRLAEAASADDPAAWADGRVALTGLDGRGWLLVDQQARTSTYGDGVPVYGVRGWLGPALAEPTGFVAAVTSVHVDGRFRERAAQVLATMPAEIAVPALTVRLLDHVPQVRASAWIALRPLVRADTAEAVLDVLLAGPDRQHASSALDQVKAALLESMATDALVVQLIGGARPRVRRWAFELGRGHGLLTTDQLVAAAVGDVDQWVRATCAEWLMEAPDPRALAPLLDAKSVEARVVAVTRLPEADLNADDLHNLLLDRAPRVREQARWRARRRGWDVAEHYRRSLAYKKASPREVAACLDGLAGVGDEQDLPAAGRLLRHASGRVRAAAVVAVEARAARDEAAALLTPLLVDPTPRVSSAAARALARLGVPPSAAEPAWASARSSDRRAAWRLVRAAGGWHRVEADLRAAADPDPQLSGLGQAGVKNWLDVGAATTWAPLHDDQRARIAGWLAEAGLDRARHRTMAFYAGIELPESGDRRATLSVVRRPPPARRSTWFRRR